MPRCNRKLASTPIALACLLAAMLPHASAIAQEVDPAAPPPERFEWSLVPAFGRNSDLGFQFGVAFIPAWFEPGYQPYRWRASNAAGFSVKETPDGASAPWLMFSSRWDLPGLLGGRLRLQPDVTFSRTANEGYYGQGNASHPLAPPPGSPDPAHYQQYGISGLRLRLNARVPLVSSLSLVTGAYLRQVSLTVYPGSRLAEDLEKPRVPGSPRLLGRRPHVLMQLAAGLLWDSRDHETIPSRGFFHEVSVRGAITAPGGADARFVGLTVHLRGFVPLWGDALVLAVRALGDTLFGAPPLYEMVDWGAFETNTAPGGACGVRGVALGRYSGLARVVGSVELRSLFLRFRVLRHRFRVGASAFVDTGRVWASYRPNRALDGTGAGVTYGVGGGPRVLWGQSVVVRFDVAYSPDAAVAYPNWPVAFYAAVDQAF